VMNWSRSNIIVRIGRIMPHALLGGLHHHYFRI